MRITCNNNFLQETAGVKEERFLQSAVLELGITRSNEHAGSKNPAETAP
jgi:hypothetical protein